MHRNSCKKGTTPILIRITLPANWAHQTETSITFDGKVAVGAEVPSSRLFERMYKVQIS